jgi:hypothetical protein
LYSNLRFVISASVVGCAGLIGVLALLPATLEDRLLASAELSAPAARPCKQQNWLNLDRNCLTRRGMPWVAARPAPDAAQASSSADQALIETPSSAAAEAAQPGEVTASRQETAPAPIAEEPGAATQTSEAVPPPQQEPTLPQQAAITPPQEPVSPQQETAASQPDPVLPKQQAAAPQPEQVTPQQQAAAPQPEQAAPQQQAAAPQPEQVAPQQEAAAPQPEPPAPQQEASAPAVPEEPQHTTKRRNVTPVRHVAPAAAPLPVKGRAADIPVSSYAADGTPRTIVIRPTSIQDVYYYSAPR